MRLGLALTALLLAVTGCGGDDPERAVDPGGGDDELAAHDGQPCPPRLADPEGSEPADEAPTLATPDEAWVCTYEVETWKLQGEPAPVTGDDLARLSDALETLEPATADRMCTMELGPRAMVVTSSGGDLTGVVVDLFGCHDVRLTEEPHETAPGGDGALSSTALATLVRELAGSAAR